MGQQGVLNTLQEKCSQNKMICVVLNWCKSPQLRDLGMQHRNQPLGVSAFHVSKKLHHPGVSWACCNHLGVQAPIPNIFPVQKPYSNGLWVLPLSCVESGPIKQAYDRDESGDKTTEQWLSSIPELFPNLGL